MVKCFNFRDVASMEPELKAKIIDLGIPIELYEKGYTNLGPFNKSSVMKFAIINTQITKYELPLYPSLYTRMVVERCTGKSKQDFREIIDGQPGAGKSYTALYGGARYGIEAADLYGQDPKDYFSLGNCALLQDTEGVTHLLDELDKEQAVVIDDAGVSAGHKDFATQSSKNLDAIMATCRTKRWYVIFTAPMNKHIDLNIRELVYCRGKVFKSCHDAGFNIVEHQRVIYKHLKGKYNEFNPHYIYDVPKDGGGWTEQRVELYSAFSPDILDPYTHIIEDYDTHRDSAADSLIHDKAVAETERKNPIDKRKKKSDEEFDKHWEVVYQMTHDGEGNWLPAKSVENRIGGYSTREIMKKTGITDRGIMKIISRLQENGAPR